MVALIVLYHAYMLLFTEINQIKSKERPDGTQTAGGSLLRYWAVRTNIASGCDINLLY